MAAQTPLEIARVYGAAGDQPVDEVVRAAAGCLERRQLGVHGGPRRLGLPRPVPMIRSISGLMKASRLPETRRTLLAAVEIESREHRCSRIRASTIASQYWIASCAMATWCDDRNVFDVLDRRQRLAKFLVNHVDGLRRRVDTRCFCERGVDLVEGTQRRYATQGRGPISVIDQRRVRRTVEAVRAKHVEGQEELVVLPVPSRAAVPHRVPDSGWPSSWNCDALSVVFRRCIALADGPLPGRSSRCAGPAIGMPSGDEPSSVMKCGLSNR